MRKITNFLLLLVSLFFLGSVAVESSSFELVQSGGAGYRVVERLEENDLKFGVKHYFDKAETMRDGKFYDQEVNVLEIPYNSKANIVSYGNHKNHKWTLTTVTDLAIQFEQEFPDQKVLAAVNGDFFDISGNGNLPYQTNNPLVTNGEYFKTTGNNAVGFRKAPNKTALVGGRPTKSEKMILAVYAEDGSIAQEFQIDKLNQQPAANETSIYFGTYNANKQYVPINVGEASKVFVVGNAEYALPNNANDFYGRGEITSLEPVELQVGQFAIATNNAEVRAALDVGVKIRAQYEFTGDFAGVANITGQNAMFVLDGEYNPHPNNNNNTHARHPRTVAGVKRDGTIVLSVIDGRAEAAGRWGMFGNEMAALMKSWGVVEAYNLDGGGSSYMIVKEQGKFVVKSSPSDGGQRRNGNALLVTVEVPLIEVETEAKENSITFNLDLKKTNGYDIKELYVKIGDELKQVVNGKATFTGLESNTELYYELYYKDSKGKVDTLLIDGNVKTLKQQPIINSVLIDEDATTYTFSIDYVDVDKGTDLNKAIIFVNDTKFTLQDGKIILPKSTFDEIIVQIDVLYNFNDNVTNKGHLKSNVRYRLLKSNTTENLYEIYRTKSERILGIYS